MSYILDALKKANAEREHERGAPPGLHTQPVRAVSVSPAQTGLFLKKRTALLLAVVAALFLCAVTMGALFWPPLHTPPPLSEQQIVTSPSIAAHSGPATTAAPTGPAPVLADPVRITPAPYSLTPPASAAPETPSAPPVKPGTPTVSPRPRPAPTPRPAPPAPSQLPANVRATLPPLVISGSTYSDNPAYRMLIVNGQVYREGEFPAPDLKLEQIRQKSALLHYKGNTYALPY